MHRVTVAATHSYDVVVAPGFEGLAPGLAALGPSRWVVVTDDVVGPIWSAALFQEIGRWPLITMPAGESQKGWGTLQSLIDGLLAAKVDRHTGVLVLGGGVASDIGGLAAALVLRGLPWVVVPTTLLSMVDASIGGKVAINQTSGKNLVGAFHPPRMVWSATHTLRTLPRAELIAGFGEVLKTALVQDAALIDGLAAGTMTTDDAIRRCVTIKAGIVSRDELERGERVVLNAGHTVGHALEAALGYGSLRHGEAVLLGLVAETAWAVAEGICVDGGLPTRLVAAAVAVGLPEKAPQFDIVAMQAAMGLDKKASGDTLLLPVAVEAGRMAVISLPRHRLSELMEFLPV